MRMPVIKLTWICCLFMAVDVIAESEPIESSEVSEAPYAYVGRLFASSSANGSKQSGSGTAVGPGVVLTAAHVYWTESWGIDDESLPDGASPWLANQEWVPQASASADDSYDNVVSVVSLAGYDDMLHEYDDNRRDGTSPFEAFNRDSLLLIFSDDEATPYGYMPIHPRAVESGLLGNRNFYEVLGYPSAKYLGGDSRKWLMHKTTETEPVVLSGVPSSVYDGGYSFANSLFFGGEPLDSYAGNSGGPTVFRAHETEPWYMMGVYVGSNALIRAADQELSDLVDLAVAAQFEETDPRFRFTAPSVSVGEGDGMLTVGVERLGDATNGAIAAIEKADFLAEQSSDYGDLSSLFWPEGESGIKEIEISILEDELREGAESFLLSLNVVDADVEGPGTLHVTIEDNDLNQPLDMWTTIDEVGSVNYSEVVFGKGVFVSVGLDNAVFWTPDYEEVGVKKFPNINRLFQVIYGRGLFVGSGDGPEIIVSENGKDWEIVTLPTSISLMSVQYGNGLFVGAGGISALSSSQGEVWVSEDARTWTKVYDEQHDRFEDIEFGNGIFLALAGEDFYWSADGLAWEKIETVGLGGEPGDFEFGAGRFVNAGRQGRIHHSVDGETWTQVREGDEEAWYGVGYRNGYFLTTGIAGKLSTSEDGGETWVDRFPDTRQSLWHGITAMGKMVVIGDNGHLMEALLPEFFDYRIEPYDQSVGEADSVSFMAEFVSSDPGPYSFQWQKDGVDISGENTETLTIDSVTPSEAGDYKLITSLAGQDYPSSIATLDIKLRINPPANLAAATATSRGVSLSWEDDSLGESQYRVERRIIGENSWEFVSDLEPNSTSFIDLRLLPETDYEYRVSALSEGNTDVSAVTVVKTLSATNFINLSTRGLVGGGDDVMIGGFTIPPGPEMTLYFRGLGPSLQSSGISNTMLNPTLRVVRSQQSNPFEIVNDDWMDASNAVEIMDAGLPPMDASESAILATLPPGGYTVILSAGENEPLGVGMVEIYDITADCSSCRITNLSTRALVSSGEELMIGGLVISGIAEKEVYVRALGPSLSEVPGRLQDPGLNMVPADGVEMILDDWMDSSHADRIIDLGLPPPDEKESAELYRLTNGVYTFQVSSADTVPGVALLELYEVQ